MTSPVPTHRDIAKALGAVLATHRGEIDNVLKVLGAERRSGEDYLLIDSSVGDGHALPIVRMIVSATTDGVTGPREPIRGPVLGVRPRSLSLTLKVIARLGPIQVRCASATRSERPRHG